jgi:cyanophycin synthetase
MLIEKENAKEIRLDNARSPLCKIKIDDNLKDFLALQNKDLTYIPDAGEKITLRRVANISAGGVSINVTSKIHPDNVKLVENIARYFKVKCLGIDVLAQDISKSWREGNFGIIEINAGPGVFMHLAPAYGGSIDVPKHIMLSHFDTQTKGRIPIIAGNFIPQQMMEKIVSILNDEYKDYL